MWFMFSGIVLLAGLEMSDFVSWGVEYISGVQDNFAGGCFISQSSQIHKAYDSNSWQHFMFSVTATLATFYWIAGLGYLWFTASVSSLDLQFNGMISALQNADLFVKVILLALGGTHACWSLQNMCQSIHVKDVPFSQMQHGCYELLWFQFKQRPMILAFGY